MLIGRRVRRALRALWPWPRPAGNGDERVPLTEADLSLIRSIFGKYDWPDRGIPLKPHRRKDFDEAQARPLYSVFATYRRCELNFYRLRRGGLRASVNLFDNLQHSGSLVVGIQDHAVRAKSQSWLLQSLDALHPFD